MNRSTPMPSAPFKVLVVEGHPIVRYGLQRLLDDAPDLSFCGAPSSPAEALVATTALKPDLVILDPSFGNQSNLELLSTLHALKPSISVLVLSRHDDAYSVDRALRAGAMGYVTRKDSIEEIIAAVHQVLSGRVYLGKTMANSILQQLVGRKAAAFTSPIDRLTIRELQVLQLIGKSIGTRQIADQLHLGIKAVEHCRARLKNKLGLRTGSQLIHYAILRELRGY